MIYPSLPKLIYLFFGTMLEYERISPSCDRLSEYQIIPSGSDKTITLFSICIDAETDLYTRTIVYTYSLRTKYISRRWTNTNTDVNQQGIELGISKKLKIMYPAAILNRLSKATGHDYMDGYILRVICACDRESYFVPEHWTLSIKKIRYDVFMINDIFDHWSIPFINNTPTVEYICGIGIPVTRAIMQISDVAIVCEN